MVWHECHVYRSFRMRSGCSGLGRVVWRRLLGCRFSTLPGGGGALRFGRALCKRMRGCAGNGHSPCETQDVRKLGVPPGEKCAEYSGYVRPDSVVASPVHVWSVTGSLLFGSPLRRVWGIQQPPLPSRDPTWIVLVGFWLSCRLVWWCIMSSGSKLPTVDRRPYYFFHPAAGYV